MLIVIIIGSHREKNFKLYVEVLGKLIFYTCMCLQIEIHTDVVIFMGAFLNQVVGDLPVALEIRNTDLKH